MRQRQRNIAFLSLTLNLDNNDAAVLLSDIEKMELDNLQDCLKELQEGEIEIGRLDELELKALAFAECMEEKRPEETGLRPGIISFLRIKIGARLGYSGAIRFRKGWKITAMEKEKAEIEMEILREAEALNAEYAI